MIKPITWNINKSDGSYLGQTTAFAEDIAFTKCKSLTGKNIVPGDLDLAGLSEIPARITYRSEDYFMTPLT